MRDTTDTTKSIIQHIILIYWSVSIVDPFKLLIFIEFLSLC